MHDTVSYLMSSWIFWAGLAYVCHAVNVILDKILLGEKRIASPLSYAFYGGIWSILAVVLVPFAGAGAASLKDFFTPSWAVVLPAFISGTCSLAALWAFYGAVKSGEASRVSTILGGLSPILVLALSSVLFGSFLTVRQFSAFGFFILGSIIISHRDKNYDGRMLSATMYWTIGAAIFFALMYVTQKIVFGQVPFIQGFVWTRIGAFSAALSLLLFPALRAQVFQWSPRSSSSTSELFIMNKLIGASGFFLVSYAVKLAAPSEVSLINAMQGLEYALVFLLALVLSVWRPSLFEEQIDAGTIARKVAAILLVSAGLFLLA